MIILGEAKLQNNSTFTIWTHLCAARGNAAARLLYLHSMVGVAYIYILNYYIL